MCVRSHFQPNHFCLVHVDDHTLDLENLIVSNQWILPGLQLRMSDRRVHEVHFANATAVVLEGGDFLRIRGPQQYRFGAPYPSRIVGRIAEILRPVSCQLYFLAASGIAYPQIELPDECRSLAIWRQNAVRHIGTTRRFFTRGALDVACPAFVADVESDVSVIVFEGEGREWQPKGFVCGPGCCRKRCGYFHVIESGAASAPFGIDEKELVTSFR